MTTKPASPVEAPPDGSAEQIAYDSVGKVPTVEPNDGSRLGYHVWRWITSREGSLEDAVRESGARLNVTIDEAVRLISEQLASRGVTGA